MVVQDTRNHYYLRNRKADGIAPPIHISEERGDANKIKIEIMQPLNSEYSVCNNTILFLYFRLMFGIRRSVSKIVFYQNIHSRKDENDVEHCTIFHIRWKMDFHNEQYTVPLHRSIFVIIISSNV